MNETNCTYKFEAFENSFCVINFVMIFVHIYLVALSLQVRRQINSDWWILMFCKTISDLLIVISIILLHWGCTYNEVQTVLIWFGYSTSSLFTAMLLFEKLLYFHYPLQYPIIVTKRKLFNASAICSATTFTFSAVILLNCKIVNDKQDKCDCEEKLAHFAIFVPYFIIFFLIPMISSFVMSVILWRTINRKCIGHFVMPRTRTSKSAKQHFKTLAFVFGSSIWFTVTLFPYAITFLLLEYSPSPSCDSKFGRNVTAEITKLYPVINPFIVISIYPVYRKVIKKNYHQLKHIIQRYVMKTSRKMNISTITLLPSRKVSVSPLCESRSSSLSD